MPRDHRENMFKYLRIFFGKRNPGNYIRSSTVHFDRPDSCDKNHSIRQQTRTAAFDVEKLLHSDVGTETSFGNDESIRTCKNIFNEDAKKTHLQTGSTLIKSRPTLAVHACTFQIYPRLVAQTSSLYLPIYPHSPH